MSYTTNSRAYNDSRNQKVWTIQKCTPCNLIFIIKHDGNGENVKCKARLVAKAYSQKYGFDSKFNLLKISQLILEVVDFLKLIFQFVIR